LALAVNGFEIHKARLSPEAQAALVEDLRRVVAAAPLFTPVTARGQPMSVRMTSCGALGWVSDRRGYRYEPRHPSGAPWPPIPEAVLALWRDLVPVGRDPDFAGRSCRSASATRRSFAWAGWSGAIRPPRSRSRAATSG
jgi:alkylated DNA repair protein (DNA oxidative demethylase)